MTSELRDIRRKALGYWEKRRPVYNLALLAAALTGYLPAAGISAGVGDVRQLDGVDVLLLFAVSAVGANICYSFAYSFEFLFGGRAGWLRYGRQTTFVAGVLVGMLLALTGGQEIAFAEYDW